MYEHGKKFDSSATSFAFQGFWLELRSLAAVIYKACIVLTRRRRSGRSSSPSTAPHLTHSPQLRPSFAYLRVPLREARLPPFAFPRMSRSFIVRLYHAVAGSCRRPHPALTITLTPNSNPFRPLCLCGEIPVPLRVLRSLSRYPPSSPA